MIGIISLRKKRCRCCGGKIDRKKKVCILCKSGHVISDIVLFGRLDDAFYFTLNETVFI